MKLSLVIATYQRIDELDRLLLSLAHQTARNFEIIVVDQNPDGRLDPIVDKFVRKGLEITHLRQGTPNLSQARNRGVAIASGAIVGFPDDDSWYDTDLIKVVRQRFEDEPNCDGIVATWVEQASALPNTTRAPAALDWADWKYLRGGPASSICLFFRIGTFYLEEQFSGFDERLGVGQWYGSAEETDFLMRLLQAGRKIAREPRARIHHVFDQSSDGALLSGFAVARARARGTGALYAKHELGYWVILRGLISPIFARLRAGARRHGLLTHAAVLIGRLEGWLAWRSKRARMADYVPVFQPSLETTRLSRDAQREDSDFLPTIWVVIPTFNRCAVLLECLTSIKSQSYPKIKAVVVEDGCSDPTGDQVAREHPEVVLLHGDGNCWWSGCMNIGLAHVLQHADDRDYICSFNDDVLIDPSFFETLLAESRRLGGENMVGALAVDSEQPDRVVFSGTIINWRSGVWRGITSSEGIESPPTRSDSLPGRGALFSLAVARQTGLYDAVQFPQYFGDEDFALRARAQGVRLYVSHRARLKSHYAMTGTGRVNQNLRSYARSLFSIRSPNQLSRRARFIWRHAPVHLRLSFIAIDFLKVVTAYWRKRQIRQTRSESGSVS